MKVAGPVVVLCLLVQIVAAQTSFVSFGTPGAAESSQAQAINIQGTVAFTTQNPVTSYLRNSDAALQVIAPPTTFDDVRIRDVNDSGVSTGTAFSSANSSYRAVRRDETGGLSLLPIPSGFQSSFASSINASGLIGGVLRTAQQVQHAYLFDSLQGFTLIPAPAKGLQPSTFGGMNDAGQVVGAAQSGTGSFPFVYRAESGSVILPTPGFLGGLAYDINIAETVVGTVSPGGSVFAPARWDDENGLALLQNYPGSTYGVATAVNARGDIVGVCSPAASQAAAVAWTAEEGFVDLNTLIAPVDRIRWHLLAAYDINDNRQIVGDAWFDPDGPTGPMQPSLRGFLLPLPPVPEPTGVVAVLLLSGLARRRCSRMPRDLRGCA